MLMSAQNLVSGSFCISPPPTHSAVTLRPEVLALFAWGFCSDRLVVGGGAWGLVTTEKKEAPFAATVLEWLGLERGRIQLEDQARNTYENALFSYRVAAPKPDEMWLLVTSAFHMPRAIGSFRRAGWDVRAYPVHFIYLGITRPQVEVSITARLKALDLAVHEYLGLLFYWLTDKTEYLFPGP